LLTGESQVPALEQQEADGVVDEEKKAIEKEWEVGEHNPVLNDGRKGGEDTGPAGRHEEFPALLTGAGDVGVAFVAGALYDLPREHVQVLSEVVLHAHAHQLVPNQSSDEPGNSNGLGLGVIRVAEVEDHL